MPRATVRVPRRRGLDRLITIPLCLPSVRPTSCATHPLKSPRIGLESSGLVEPVDVVGCRPRVGCRPARRACPRSRRSVRDDGPFGASGRHGTNGAFERTPRSAAGFRGPRFHDGRAATTFRTPRRGRRLAQTGESAGTRDAPGGNPPVGGNPDVNRFSQPRRFKANERRLSARVAQLVGPKVVRAQTSASTLRRLAFSAQTSASDPRRLAPSRRVCRTERVKEGKGRRTAGVRASSPSAGRCSRRP